MLSPDICQKNGDVEESRLPPFHNKLAITCKLVFPKMAFRGSRNGFVKPRKFIVLQSSLACE